MKRIATSFALALGLAACTVGDPDQPRSQTADIELIDEDGDGVPDGIDLDGDGVADVNVGAPCEEPLVDGDGDGEPDGVDLDCDGAADIAWCEEPLIDDDGDGVPDGVDLDCDGAADLELPDLPEPPDPGDLPEPPDPGDLGLDCIPEPLDGDGDGVYDGIDLDCDGAADIEF